jgi:O-methyltransferase
VASTTSSRPAVAQDLYLDLLINCLTRYTFDRGLRSAPPKGKGRLKGRLWRSFEDLHSRMGFELRRRVPLDTEKRSLGLDWPEDAETMIGMARMQNLRESAIAVIEDEVPGDFIETGVWRGGACILMRGVLAAYGVADRNVWVADSFRGLPPPSSRYAADEGDIHHTFDELAVSRQQVEENFRRYGLLDGQVKFLEGWFSETLPSAPVERLALLRLDGDMYESTMDALSALYPKLSPGGYVIVDDYGNPNIPACRAAVTDYRDANGIEEEIQEIDWTGVYWRKAA